MSKGQNARMLNREWECQMKRIFLWVFAATYLVGCSSTEGATNVEKQSSEYTLEMEGRADITVNLPMSEE